MKIINIVVDTSGSMNEMGKNHLQRNLCRYLHELRIINEQKYSNIEFRYYQWSSSVTNLFVQESGEFPVLTPKGEADMVALSEYLKSMVNDEQELHVLIITDGQYSYSEITEFKKGLEKYQNIALRVVAVGADADIAKMKKLSTNGNVYLAENISAAICSICFGTDNRVNGPNSLTQIQISPAAEA